MVYITGKGVPSFRKERKRKIFLGASPSKIILEIKATNYNYDSDEVKPSFLRQSLDCQHFTKTKKFNCLLMSGELFFISLN